MGSVLSCLSQVFVLLSDMSADVRAAAITALARMRDRGQHFTTVIAQRLKAEGEEAKVRIAVLASAQKSHPSICHTLLISSLH